MVDLNEKEKQLLVGLVKSELESFEKDEKELENFKPDVDTLGTEEKYDEFLKKLLEKLVK